MNGLPYYRAFPRDFIDGTVGMPFELKGAYRIIIDLIYLYGGALPDDARYVSGVLGMSVRKWKSVRQGLLDLGKIHVENEMISNSRADVELEWAITRQEKQAKNARGPRKNKGIQKPRQNHTDTDTDTEETKSVSSVPARKRAAPKTRIKPDALISERMRSAAEQRGLSDAEAEAQFVKFRDWAVAKGQAYADWDAAWRNWLTSPYFAPVLGNVTKLNRMSNDAERLDGYLDEFAARLALQRPG